MLGFLRKKAGRPTDEKQRVRAVFSKIVSPEAAEAVLDKAPLKIAEPRPAHLGIVLAWIEGAEVGEIAVGIRSVVEVASRHDAMVWSITGPLVVMSLGAFRENQASFDPEALRRFVAELAGLDNRRLKLVHANGTAQVGLFGSETGVCLYSFVFPRFEEMLAALTRTEAGQVIGLDL